MTHVDRVNRLTATVAKRKRSDRVSAGGCKVLRRLPDPASLPVVVEEAMKTTPEKIAAMQEGRRKAREAKKAKVEKLADSTRSAAVSHADICLAVAAGGDKTMMTHALKRAAHLLKLMARKS